MSGQLGELVIEISGNIARFTEATTKAQYQSQKMGESIGKSVTGIQGHFDKMSMVVTRVTGLLAAIGGAGAFVGFIKSSIDAADNLNKMSQKIGVSVEDLSALKYAGDLADVSIEQLGIGLKQLNKNIMEAGTGSKEQTAAFHALGVSFRTADGQLRSANDVLLDVSDVFSKMPDGVEKTALSMKLFGKSGSDMIPLLNAGKDGIKGMREEAQRLGVIMSGDFAKSAEEFNDNLTRLKISATGLGYSIANGLLPYMNDLVESIVNMRKTSGIKDFTKELLVLDQTALNIMTGPTRGLLNKLLPESMEIQPFEFTGPKKKDQALKAATAKPVDDTMKKYLEGLNEEAGKTKAAELQKRWNDELLSLQGKLDAANPSLNSFEKKIAELNAAEKKLLSDEGATEYADKIKKAFNSLRDFEGGEIIGKAMKDAFQVLEDKSDEAAKRKLENEQLLNDANILSLEMSGEYVAAEELKQQAIQKSVEFLELKTAAELGNADALIRLTTIEKQWAIDTVNTSTRGADAFMAMNDAIKSLAEAYDALMGKDQSLIKFQRDLESGQKAQQKIEKDLELAIRFKNEVAIAGLQAQLDLQKQLNSQLAVNLKFEEEVKVLLGEIVGFANGMPIFKDDWKIQNQYKSAQQSIQQSSKKIPVGTNYWGEPIDAQGNVINPFNLPQYANGTDYVPHTGLALVHQGEKITPAGQNSGNPINISGGISVVLPNVTSATDYPAMARGVFSELKRLGNYTL